MTTVIIAAHDEESVIGSCLDALLAQSDGHPLEVVVSANGCSDRTADIARERPVTVIERAEPGKAGALNAGDAAASTFPRIYLDADIVVPDGALRDLCAALAAPGVAAAVPRRRIDTRGRPLLVKAYFAINERLPAFRTGLFGRGVIALSEAGRGRFEQFPTLIADDLFLDSLFAPAEKVQVPTVEIRVEAPYRTRDLLARLIRVRRGNAQLRAAAGAGDLAAAVRPSARWSWLRDVVLREPRLAVAAVPYVLITVLAGALARREGATGWGRDSSTRGAKGPAR
ncbi:glycosyltransferase [Cumulibacter manganitolerans]|uniref:glycosyltransferase n=1 Tax=Cumulibacter manganitolerans TaxID=1884992 RepID=UPI0012956B79|nr:glycosyltransferase family 2 protein [Cumulibacter manganitolerans]